MVVNIRGTSGSGKTTVVRGIMAKGEVQPILPEGAKKPEGYRVVIPEITRPLYVIGSYENVCGGCDSLTPSTQDEICRRVRLYATEGHVMMEGLLMSHLFSRYAMLDRELFAQGIPFIWAFLDTPIEVCLERVVQRREERGNFNPLNEKNTRDKHADMFSVYDKATKQRERDWKKVIGYKMAKLDARWIDHTHAVEQVFAMLQETA